MIVAFVDEMRSLGHTVESVCRVLSEQGCQVAVRSYRAWKQPGAGRGADGQRRGGPRHGPGSGLDGG